MKSQLLLVTASLSVLIACGGTKTEEPAAGEIQEPVTEWPATRTTEGGGFDVTLKPGEGGIVRNTHFALEVAIVARGEAAGEFGVKVDADMPAHGHGMNTKPEITELEPGRYRVEGMLLHMGGDWVITADVTSGGETVRATFPISVE